VRYLLHHITDSELVYLERLRRAISERNVVVWYCDQDAWAKGLDYSTRPLESSRILFTAVRWQSSLMLAATTSAMGRSNSSTAGQGCVR
jgi:hypothetical protein